MSRTAEAAFAMLEALDEADADPDGLVFLLAVDAGTLLLNVDTFSALGERPPAEKPYLLDTVQMHARLRTVLEKLGRLLGEQEQQVAALLKPFVAAA